MEESASVIISIYNSTGQVIRTLNLGNKPAGFYVDKTKAAHWDGRNEVGETVTSGVYFVVLKAGEYHQIRRMALVK